MKRARKLGNVEFTLNSLFIREQMQPDSKISEMQMSAAGTHIVYMADIATPYITLDSMQYGWIDDTQREELLSMWAAQDDTVTYVLTYDDNSTEIVRMAVEKEIVFTPLFEGACIYTAVIPLAKA